MANTDGTQPGVGGGLAWSWRLYLGVAAVAGIVYLGCAFSPPHLMDDVDAVQAQIARNMIASGDWVTARLDGVAYLEKAPLVYWLIAIFYKVCGPHDWSARLPIALAAIGLCCIGAAMGRWAFGDRAGLYAGLVLATCIGLFLFTRVLIPDVILTATIALAMWAFLRAIDDDEPRPRLWSTLLPVSLGAGLLLKSLISIVFPVGTGIVYLLITHRLFDREVWRRLRPFSGTLIVILIAAPWHVLATLRNPPYFSFELHSGPGQYHGFLWFFFINEQLLRFLNRRYPRDYNTVPRLYFWLFHFLWLFPWSAYIPSIFKLSFKPTDRAGRMRLLALCWIGVVLVFFTFSTTQEYYSMPCYPALALLLGSAMAAGGSWIKWGARGLSAVALLAGLITLGLLVAVRNVPAPGDISEALSHHPGSYTLALGHMQDLTIDSFAYLRLPLAVASVAFLIGAFGGIQKNLRSGFLATTLMMVVFLHAARLAMVVFDPFLSSYPLAVVLMKSPEGQLIVDHHYYWFSSVFFYTNRTALLLNGKFNNLEYGAAAPDAPNVFIDDDQFKQLWLEPGRYYIVLNESARPRLEGLVGSDRLIVAMSSGGKLLLTNHDLPQSDASVVTE
ncbi:MAG TPA: glycosyltransferase family 39 protein [Blastocatellia bacterium]